MKETNAGATTGLFGNLLRDNIICVRTRRGEIRSVALPKLLALLMADEVESLPALRPHQRYPLHCFLAQVAAMAMLADGESALPRDENCWRDLLCGLTSEFKGEEPWTLVVDDWSMPGFLQPPVPKECIVDYSQEDESIFAADEFDLPVTSRNHDVKGARMHDVNPEYWVFSLISNQTFQGGNSGSYRGISRMNGDYGSRPFVGAAPSNEGFGSHLARDIRFLVGERDALCAKSQLHATSGGIALLWLEPWDGKSSIETKQLNPYYAEVCRRVRLRRHGQTILAQTATNKLRINQPKGKHQGKDFTLPTGDPWTPVHKESGKPLTLDGTGFDYRRVVDLLDGEKFKPAPLQLLFDTEEKGGAQIVCAAVVRGQGETQGFHERRIQVPERLKPVFMRKSASDDMARIARDRVADVATTISKALRPALFALYQAPKEINLKDPERSINRQDPKSKAKAKIFIAQFERAVDEDFFERLFEEVAEPVGSEAATACRKRWIERYIWQRARDALAAAEAGSPLSGVRRYRARAAAEHLLNGAIVNAFLDLVSANL
jgi:CRISPR system Cascade subunit CasA